jgi:hypothetical protein
MSTGNNKNNAGATKAVGLRFDLGRLVVELDDHREVSIPLNRYPTLAGARPAQRAEWQSIGPGKGFHWPALDLDLSVAGIVSGLPEVVPAPPRRSAARPRRLTDKAHATSSDSSS